GATVVTVIARKPTGEEVALVTPEIECARGPRQSPQPRRTPAVAGHPRCQPTPISRMLRARRLGYPERDPASQHCREEITTWCLTQCSKRSLHVPRATRAATCTFVSSPPLELRGASTLPTSLPNACPPVLRKSYSAVRTTPAMFGAGI